jgi:WD40 repeat protein
MLDRIVNALRQVGADFDSVTLAEALWLQDRIHRKVESQPRPAPGKGINEPPVSPTTPGAATAPQGPSPGSPPPDAHKTSRPPALLKPVVDIEEDRPAPVISIAAPHSLRARQELIAALGPLMVRNPRPEFAVDLDATVDAIAAAGGLPVEPQPRAGERRWLDLVLLTETGPQTPIWNSTFRELEIVLRARGAFGSFVRFNLTSEAGAARLMDTRSNAKRSAREVSWPRDTLIVIASDFVSEGWWSGAFGAAIDEWRRSNHVLLLHLLPRELWPQTWTGAADMRVSGQVPGGASTSLLAVSGNQRRSYFPVASSAPRAVSIAHLNARDIGKWASVVVAESATLPAIRLAGRAAVTPRDQGKEIEREPGERVEAFRARASPQAIKLGRYLSVTAPLSFPMMQWVQQALLPQSESGHLAEFFLGGLLKKVAGQAGSDSAVYDFLPGVRQHLSQGMEVSEALDVMKQVGAHLQNTLRLKDQPFLLVRAGQAAKLSDSPQRVQGFAEVSQEYLRRAGLLTVATQYANDPETAASDGDGDFDPLSDFAQRYDQVRASMSAGNDRTRVMTDLLREIVGFMRRANIDFEHLRALFATDKPGNRLVAIAGCTAAWNPAATTLLASALRSPASAFEQWATLRSIETAIEQFDPFDVEGCVAAVFEALDDPLNKINDSADESRRSLARSVLRKFSSSLTSGNFTLSSEDLRVWLSGPEILIGDHRPRAFVFGSTPSSDHSICDELGSVLAQAGWELHISYGRNVGKRVITAFRPIAPDSLFVYSDVTEFRKSILANADCGFVIGGQRGTQAECEILLEAGAPLIAYAPAGGTAKGMLDRSRASLENIGVPASIVRLLTASADLLTESRKLVRMANIARLKQIEAGDTRARLQEPESPDEEVELGVATVSFYPQGELRQGHQNVILRTSWSPDGARLATCSADGTAVIWDLRTQRQIARLTGHSHGVNQVAWSAMSGRYVATCSFDRTIRIWTTNNWKSMRQLVGHEADVRDVCWSPDETLLASASADQHVFLWDAKNGKRLSGYTRRRTGEARRTLWIEAGRNLLAVWKTGEVVVFDPSDGRLDVVRDLACEKSGVTDIALSRDERLFAVSFEDGTVQIWSWPGFALLKTLSTGKRDVRSVSFSYDGHVLAANTIGTRGAVHAWETADWREVATFKEPTSEYWPPNVAWAPESHRLASLGAADTQVRMWAVEIALAPRNDAEATNPPTPGPVLHEDDPQKDRWGGQATRDGRSVEVRLKRIEKSDFYFDVVVHSTDDSPLEGPIVFHLHSSYARSVIRITKIRERSWAALEQVSSYGVYVIAVQVRRADGEWTSLEIDLASQRSIPKRFKKR